MHELHQVYTRELPQCIRWCDPSHLWLRCTRSVVGALFPDYWDIEDDQSYWEWRYRLWVGRPQRHAIDPCMTADRNSGSIKAFRVHSSMLASEYLRLKAQSELLSGIGYLGQYPPLHKLVAMGRSLGKCCEPNFLYNCPMHVAQTLNKLVKINRMYATLFYKADAKHPQPFEKESIHQFTLIIFSFLGVPNDWNR